MKILFSLLLIFAVLVIGKWTFFSFKSQKITDYAGTVPVFNIQEVLNGPIISEGMIYGPTGKVVSRFVADMEGNWDGQEGTLAESFSYANGGKQERKWLLTMGENGAFTATADDIIGVATGQQMGSAVRMHYRIRLPEASGGHVLDVTDWLYLVENGTILNRSELRKFGFKVAELVATMRPAGASKDAE